MSGHIGIETVPESALPPHIKDALKCYRSMFPRGEYVPYVKFYKTLKSKESTNGESQQAK